MSPSATNTNAPKLGNDASLPQNYVASSRLFKPLRVGNMQLQHRIAMAPLTRVRATLKSRVPTQLMKEYYNQRASVPGTLITSEAIIVSQWLGGGFFGAPGIWSSEQVEAWREIVDSVHSKGSYIVAQLFAFGRVISAAEAKEDGVEVVGASPVRMEGNDATPRELTSEELGKVVEDFEQAARNAVEAGFDAIEVHGANGYLLNQFLNDRSNIRTDSYGGSIENRNRLLNEVLQAVTSAVGPEKVGLRLSPWSEYQDMSMKDPIPQFSSAVEVAKAHDLAYLSLIEARVSGAEDCHYSGDHTLDSAFDIWPKEKPIFLAGAFTPEGAREVVDSKRNKSNVVVLFGRTSVSNPDFVFRIKNGLALNKYDRSTFYTHGGEGYVDYPFSKEFLIAQKQEA